MGKQNDGGIYAAMDFPEYEHREFPKEIAGPLDGAGNPTRVVVRSQREELDMLTTIRDSGKAPPQHPAEALAGDLAERLDAKHAELAQAAEEKAAMQRQLSELQAKLAAVDAPKAEAPAVAAKPTPSLPPLPKS